MGRHMKAASTMTGNDKSKTELKLLEKKEKELAGDNKRLKQGLEGLNAVELKRLINKGARDLYDSIAQEAATSSALSNNHIHDLIDLANEYEKLKSYQSSIKKYSAVVYDETTMKFSANPADKMSKDSLKAIDAIKTRLGMRAVDIVTLARQNAENGEQSKLDKLLSSNGSEIWGNES